MARGVMPVIGYLVTLALAVYASMAAAGGSAYVLPAVIGATAVMVVVMIASSILAGDLRRRWPAVILVLLTGIGLGVVGLLVSLTVDSSRDIGLFERACSPDGLVNHCQQAFQSRWAGLPMGFGDKAPRIPAVIAAVGFYSFLLAWYLVVGRPTRAERRWHLVPLGLTAIGAGMSGYLTFVMYTKLAAPCLLCLTSHIVTFPIFVITIFLWPWRGRGGHEVVPENDGPAGDIVPSWHRPATAMVLGVVLAVLGIQSRLNQSLQDQAKQYAHAYSQFADDPAFMRWDLDRQPVVDLTVRPDDSVRGAKDAPFTLVTYSDFQCPQCRALADTLAQVNDKFPGKLRVIFRHFPLDHSCNPLTKTYMHAYSCQAARAAEAARILGGNSAFWKMHDLLFEHGNKLDTRPYIRLAGLVGLRAQQFRDEMTSDRVTERISTHIESSKTLKIASTPSVFLNGRRVRRWQSMAFWETVLSSAASQPTTSQPTSKPAGNAP